jgi:hypothetical protein
MTRMDTHVPPKHMCNQHLLGNHNEAHQLVGFARSGNIDKLIGHSVRGQIDMTRLNEWHEELVAEMERRGWNHDSPLEWGMDLPIGEDMIANSSTNKLHERCDSCHK